MAEENAGRFGDVWKTAIGLLLLALTAFVVVGFFVILMRHEALLAGMMETSGEEAAKAMKQIQDAVIAMFAAGIGSCLATIMAYVRHVSEKRDFDSAHIPWYLARPLMGVLLGLIFFFLLRGGLLATVNAPSPDHLDDFNDWGLAGLSALVGLFTKNALEKLREIFDTLFNTGS